ncbi:hypothetical protein SprV_0301260100 [Sparganum proliferum]
MKLCNGEGLKLPKIGTFSFCSFDDHALGYSNRAKGKPCFYVSSWLCHQCDLKQIGSLVPSSIKYKTLNMLTVADNLEIERTKVENLLKRLCLSLQRDIISKKSAVLDFVKIGRLRVIGNVASFKFFKGFVQQLNDQTTGEVGDGQISLESSVLDTNSTANFPSLCNESQLNTFSIDYECPSTNLDASFASLNRKTHSPEAEVQSDSQTESGRCQMQIRNALNNKNEPDCANAKGSDLSLLQDEDEAVPDVTLRRKQALAIKSLLVRFSDGNTIFSIRWHATSTEIDQKRQPKNHVKLPSTELCSAATPRATASTGGLNQVRAVTPSARFAACTGYCGLRWTVGRMEHGVGTVETRLRLVRRWSAGGMDLRIGIADTRSSGAP